MMKEYEAMTARQRKWMLYLLAILVLAVGFAPYPRIFQGLLLGTAASAYNLWLLQRKMGQFAQSIEDNKTRAGIGTLSRLAAAMLVTLIALRFEEHFHIIAVVVGLVSYYIIMMADLIIHTYIRSRKRSSRN